MKHLLLCNDDGFFATGLQALYAALKSHYRITVVAPDRNCSGASHSLTLEQPLRIHQHGDGLYSVNGTPTDCAHWALNELLLNDRPDLVLSGINAGANLADDVSYSGTVAAAIEARLLGFPAIALSLAGRSDDYQAACEVALQLVEMADVLPLNNREVLNVNVPVDISDIRYQVCRLGARHPSEPMIKQCDPRGRDIYWLGPPGAQQDDSDGTDFHAIAMGYVALTPITIDLTAHQRLNDVQQWISKWTGN